MTDTKEVHYLTTGEVAGELDLDTKTVWDWMHRGVTVGGRRLVLGSVRHGRLRRTTQAWLDEFIRQCNEGQEPVAPESAAAERRRRQRARERTGRALGGEGPA